LTGSKRVTLLIPVLNEESTVEIFLDTVSGVLRTVDYDFEYLFVDDGSTDRTVEILKRRRAADKTVKIVQLSRNFGKEHALAAGLDFASGDAVIPMDVDMQDPPELIPEFLKHWEQGFEVVIGVRNERSCDSVLKRITAEIFYKIINLMSQVPITPNAGDFRLLDRKVVEVIRAMPERVRFTKGVFAWVGFPQIQIPYTRRKRSAGTSKWNYWRLWNFALDGLTGFSTVPVRIWSYIGGVIALLGFVYAFYILILSLVSSNPVPGYASLMICIMLLGGIQLISLGVIGEYLGRIYEETKGRPLYVVHKTYGIDNKEEKGSAV